MKINEVISRRTFAKGLGAMAGLAATGANAANMLDYKPRQIPQVYGEVGVEDKFVPETQQLVHDHRVYNRLTKPAFLYMKIRPDFDTTVELEQAFSQPLNRSVTLITDNSAEKQFWVTPEIFNGIKQEIQADEVMARNRRGGGLPMAKKPPPTDRLPNTMQQIDPPDPGAEQDRLYRGLNANRPA